MRYYSRIPFILLIAGLVASLWTAARRIVVERAARTVELTIDLEQLRFLALGTGVPLPEALGAMRRAGVVSAAVEERSLDAMEQDGLALVEHGPPGMRPGGTEVRIADAALCNQVTEALRLKFRVSASPGSLNAAPRFVRILGPNGARLTIPAGWGTVRLATVGLSARDAAMVRGQGLAVVGRVSNFPTADDAAIAAVAHQIRAAGAHTVIFLGDEVLGHRTRIKQTAAALEAEGVRYGSIEFGKQMGDEELSKALQARIIRVHAIQGAEMDKMTPDAVVDRFVKAAEERNIRLLYLRVFPYVSDRPFQDNVDYIAAVARGLRERGLRLGIAEPMERVYPETRAALIAAPAAEAGRGGFVARLFSRLVPAVSGVAVAGAAVLLLAGIVWLPAGTQTLLALLGGAAAGLLVLGGGDLGRELVALAGALLFPVLAFVWFPVDSDFGLRGPHFTAETQRATEEDSLETGLPLRSSAGLGASAVRSAVQNPKSPLLQFAAISLVSLMGALTVVGLLSEREFMVKVAQFVGIKVAISLPLLAIALLYAAGAFQGPWLWPELRRRARRNFGRALGLRLEVWHLVVGLVAITIVGLLLARTGNDPGVGVSGTELTFRNWLDQFLVRPRTKEFLIGHPALLATLLLSARYGRRPIFIPFAILGAVGQVSMVNSFCHLHTPLLMTVERTFNGLWLGILIGLMVTWVAGRYLPAVTAAPYPRSEGAAVRTSPPTRAGSRR